MKARIHRGASEIGGNCVELDLDGQRLVIDVGRPLDAAPDDEVDLASVSGLAGAGDGSLLGVVLSHPHQDHYGLAAQLHPAVPVHMGRAAATILEAAAFFSPSGIELEPAGFVEDRRPFVLGPFTVTPYLVDHSAFDSYALLVEGGGRRVFYSGDFRGHGRKASLLRRLCDRPPDNVHVLLLEGIHVRRDGDHQPGPDETDVELAMTNTFKRTSGLVAVFSSTQNIDRLVTVYRACKRSGRTLVVDLYTGTIAQATGRDTIPQPGFPRLRVYVPNRQRILVKRAGEFERVDAVGPHRIFLDEIRETGGDLVMLIQGSTLPELAKAGCLDEARAIWSLWAGYLDQPSGTRITRTLHQQGRRPRADPRLRSRPRRGSPEAGRRPRAGESGPDPHRSPGALQHSVRERRAAPGWRMVGRLKPVARHQAGVYSTPLR